MGDATCIGRREVVAADGKARIEAGALVGSRVGELHLPTAWSQLLAAPVYSPLTSLSTAQQYPIRGRRAHNTVATTKSPLASRC